ncbi:hypothetical protein DXT73_26915 [Escherichia coli]|nr:hypothetical protein DXT73_26915 [Escherichia coli]
MFHTIVSIKNDGHYFCRAGGNRPDGLNEPVTHAVLRAKNLRSWFSIHVYGNSTGRGFGYGYVMATEKIRSTGVITKTVPTEGQSEAGV